GQRPQARRNHRLRRPGSGQPQAQQKQQRQGGESAKQMGSDHLWPEFESYRPHAEHGLGDHHAEQQQWQLQWLAMLTATTQGLYRQDENDQAEAAGEVAVDHLVPALLHLYWRL